MEINKFNKKIVSNLILGSSLYGIPASIITTMQATSTPPQGRQSIRQYNKKATAQLIALLSKSETPLQECMNLVQFNNADPNVQIGLFTLLEEIVLRRVYGVKALIDKGADIHRVVNRQVIKDKQGNPIEYGRTLLHLAVYPPQRARELLDQHRRKKGGTIHTPKELYKLEIDDYISRISIREDLLSPRTGFVEELLDCGLGVKEIIMREAPNKVSPSVIVLDCSRKLLKSKLQQSQFHKDAKKNYDAIDKLFNKKLRGE
jgi:hypothetical protein